MAQTNNKDEKIATIARFMGLNPIPCGTMRLGDIKHPNESMAFLNYDENWELLMEVVEYIENLSDEIVNKVWISINGLSCQIYTYSDVKEVLRGCSPSDTFKIRIVGETKKSATFEALFEFICWHNDKKQPNETKQA